MKKHDRRMHDQKYDRAWPQVLALLATLAITVFFCCGFVRALEMAAW